jgi:hypothetical protein
MLEAGTTYPQMIEFYRTKYNVETSVSMWSMFRKRKGLDRRVAWDNNLIPWNVKIEHNYKYQILMLRKEARRRAGFALSEKDTHKVDTWIANLKRDGLVVHYDPDTEQGWFYVPAREGIDTDLVRVPDRPTGRKKGDEE